MSFGGRVEADAVDAVWAADAVDVGVVVGGDDVDGEYPGVGRG